MTAAISLNRSCTFFASLLRPRLITSFPSRRCVSADPASRDGHTVGQSSSCHFPRASVLFSAHPRVARLRSSAIVLNSLRPSLLSSSSFLNHSIIHIASPLSFLRLELISLLLLITVRLNFDSRLSSSRPCAPQRRPRDSPRKWSRRSRSPNDVRPYVPPGSVRPRDSRPSCFSRDREPRQRGG